MNYKIVEITMLYWLINKIAYEDKSILCKNTSNANFTLGRPVEWVQIVSFRSMLRIYGYSTYLLRPKKPE